MNSSQWNNADVGLESEPMSTEEINSSNTPQLPESHHRLRLVLLIVGVVAALALIVAGIAWKQSHSKASPATNVTISTQSLDKGTLTKLEQQSPGSTNQKLVVTPDTVYKNSVAVNDALQVNGSSNVQGSASINGNLAVRGSVSVGGQLSAGSLNVGALNVSSINASGNLAFAGHLMPSGPTPSVRAGAASGGGSAAISGTDTAGTITVTSGSTHGAGSGTGELATVTFSRAFGGTPKVQFTPVNGESAALRYYVTRSAGFFSLETGTVVAPNTTYVFDYQVTQ